ncbi:hypothetical protein COOONC_01855 [Cooperia oncophora]
MYGFSIAWTSLPPSLQHIIDRYCVHPIASDVRLTHAVLPSSSSSRRASAENDATQPASMTTSDWSPNATSIEATDDYVNHELCLPTQWLRFRPLRNEIWKLSREEKAWKPCWLTLCDDPNGGCELVVADTEVVRFYMLNSTETNYTSLLKKKDFASHALSGIF